MASDTKGGTVGVVWNIAEPIAEKLGLTLWDIRFVKEGASWYLRVFIDKEGGVSIDDCVDMSHALNDPLDEADPISQSYCLEVSSPGIERELKRDFHFEKMTGRKINIRLIRPDENKQKEFNHATLNGYDNGIISVTLDDGAERQFAKKDTAWVKTDDFEE